MTFAQQTKIERLDKIDSLVTFFFFQKLVITNDKSRGVEEILFLQGGETAKNISMTKPQISNFGK